MVLKLGDMPWVVAEEWSSGSPVSTVSTILFSILQPSSKYILCLKECLWELSRETSARNTAGKTPCYIRAANLASRSVAYTFTQSRIIIFRSCQKENICWEILFSEVHCLHFTYPERRRAWRGLSGRSQRGRVCVCVCKKFCSFFSDQCPPLM